MNQVVEERPKANEETQPEQSKANPPRHPNTNKLKDVKKRNTREIEGGGVLLNNLKKITIEVPL